MVLTTRRLFPIVALLMTACGVSLDVPEGVTINCNADAECPDGFLCSSGVCEQVLSNVAPTVSIRATARGTSTLPLEVTVADANGVPDRQESVSVELGVVANGARCPITALDTSLAEVRTTRAGVVVAVTWNAIADANVACGLVPRAVDRDGDGTADAQVLPRLADVVIEATATDSGGARGATSSAAVSLGNDPPIALFEPLPASASNDVPLAFTITDTSLDLADLDLQFALPGDPQVWRSARVRYGATNDIVSDGSQQVLVWDSLNDEGGVGAVRAGSVSLRVRAKDDVDGLDYGAFDIATLAIDNQSAPSIESLQLAGDAFGRATGVAYLTYRLVDAQADPVDVRVELSVDGDAFVACTPYPNEMHSGRHGLASAPASEQGGGRSHVFAWDVVADLRTRASSNVVVRFTPADERAGSGAPATLQVGSRVGLGASYVGTGGYKQIASRAAAVGERMLTGQFNGGGVDLVTTTDVESLLVSGNGNGSFAAPVGFGPDFGLMRAIGAGDLNGDIYDDYAVQDEGLHELRVFYGGPSGLATQTSLNLPTGCEPHGRVLAIGDFNGDGQNEIAFRCGNEIRVATRATTWSLDPTSYAVGQEAFRMAAGDTNGDGRDELVLATLGNVLGSLSDFQIFVLPGRAEAQLLGSPMRLASGLPYFNNQPLPRFNEDGADLAMADLDGDGRSEIIVASSPYGYSGSVRVYRGSSLGSDPLVSDVIPERPSHLSIADVDGDGRKDVVTWACATELAPCVFMHALGTQSLTPIGRARFDAPTCGSSKRATGEAVDLDGDGRAELIASSVCGSSGTLTTYAIGAGATPTALSDVVALGEAPASSDELTLLDYDRDGALDVLVSRYDGVLTQVRAGTHRIPDVAASVSVVAGTTFTSNFLDYTYYRVVPADVNGDGLVDLYASHRDYPNSPDVSLGIRGAGGVSFSPSASRSATGLGPQRPFASGDFNRDGFDDLVGRTDERVMVMRPNVTAGVWSGSFSNVATIDTNLGTDLNHFAIADMDRDGDLDIAAATVSNTTGGPGMAVMLNDGAGNFSLACAPRISCFHADCRISGIAIADTRDDGFADVVVALIENPTAQPASAGLQLLTLPFTASGCGTLSALGSDSPIGPVDRLGVADVDGDGIMDAYAVAPQKLYVWPSAQNGGLAAGFATTPRSLTNTLARADIVDFDRDGVADVVGVTAGNAVLLAHGIQQNVADRRVMLLDATNTTGLTPTRTVDYFGDALASHVGLRRYSAFGRFAEAARIDFPADAARAGVLGSAKRPLTRAHELDGLTRLSTATSGRVTVSAALDVDADAGRAIIVDLPIPSGRWALNLTTNVTVVVRADDFVRASEHPDDALFGQAAGADMLPIVRDRVVIERTSSWLQIPRDADGDLSTGTGRRFIVENTGTSHRVRVALDVPGVVQAFVQ